MATIVYIDDDDEITSAAARIRGTDGGSVVLVLPHGSRISTSRINFRLLAREAEQQDRRLAIVTTDNATRALAASAGLSVFGSVGEFEESQHNPQSNDEATPGAGEVAASARNLTGTTPTGEPRSDAAAVRHTEATTPLVYSPAALASRPRIVVTRSRRTVVAILAAIALLALLVGTVVGWAVLPAATITLTPHEQAMSPVTLSVTADPGLASPDPSAGLVPARALTFDLAAGDTFTVKGRRVEETASSGRVTFGSKDPIRENRIAGGSVVSTQGGIRFRTTATIVIPKATFVGFTVIPGRASVGIQAVKPGPESNVDANAITVVPQGEDPALTFVQNRNPTAGGSRQEFPRIDQSDIDAAMAALSTQLDDDFDTLMREQGRVPAGFTVFDETRQLSDPVATTDPTTLVGKEVDSFELEAKSTASVIAVDQLALSAVVAEQLRPSVSSGYRLVDGSVNLQVGRASIDGTRVIVPVTTTAAQVRMVDAAALVQQIKGKSLAEARSALQPYGDVAVTLWPEWVSSIPTLDARIDLRVLPATKSTPPPSPSP
jgi:hypothetical protein